MTPWHGDYLKSTVELMKQASSTVDVIFLDYQFTWKDILVGILKPSSNIPWKNALGIKHRLQKIKVSEHQSVRLITPFPIIPSFWIGNRILFGWVNRINQFLVLSNLRSFLAHNEIMPDCILTAFNPFMGLGVSRYFPNKPHFYYCYDEIGAAHWLKNHGEYLEKKLIQEVNASIFTSNFLQQKKTSSHQPSHVVTNGVDLKNFKPFAKNCPNTLPLKKVGYLGSIDDRLDVNLLKEVMNSNPSFELHFVGRVVHQEVAEELKSIRQTFLAPPVAIDEVPRVMASLDAGIIPYVKNEFTEAIYPLKINEYLAIGLPVLMTPFALLNEFEGEVKVSGEAVVFKSLLEELLASDSEEKIHKRQKLADQNSWANKSRELLAILKLAENG